MNSKFAVDLREYVLVGCECPSCGRQFQLRLNRIHNATIKRSENGRALVICCDCAKAGRITP